MSTPKYKIKEFILIAAKYSRVECMRIREQICLACTISKKTLSIWENIAVGDKNMIPADQLLKIAKVLKVRMEDLFAPVESNVIKS